MASVSETFSAPSGSASSVRLYHADCLTETKSKVSTSNSVQEKSQSSL